MSNLKNISKEELLASLDKKSKDIESILYSMSHDLRGPVSTILGINSIINDKSSKEELHQYLDVIHRLALDLDKKMANTVELLSIANIESRKTAVIPQKMIESIFLELSSTEDDYNFNFEHVGQPTIQIEKELFYHAIKNLLDCIYSFTSTPQKSIELKSNASDSLLKIRIVSGIKLKRDTYDRLREILNGTSKTYSNLGMKLHLAKIYLRRLDGEILFTPTKSSTIINVMVPLKNQI